MRLGFLAPSAVVACGGSRSLSPVPTSGTAQVHGVQTAPAKDDQQGGDMTSGINRTDAWYIAVIIACGFITFYSLPDVTPFLVRLTMIASAQIAVGKALQWKHAQEDRP